MATMNPNFITYMKSAKKSQNTIDAYTRNINAFLKFIDKEDVDATPFDVMSWEESISNQSTATVQQKIVSVRRYYAFLKKYGLVEKNPAEDVETATVVNKPKHYMSVEMVRAMIENARTYRDKAIILTYISTGMRVSELTDITIDEYMEMKERGDNQIVVHGKGDKYRMIPFNSETQSAIDSYIKVRNSGVVNCNKLFLSEYGNKINRGNLGDTLKRIAKRAGIPFWQDVTNHQLRSGAASIYSENGVPVAVIRDLLGHSDISVTSRYIKTSTQQVKSAVMDMSFC